MIGSLCVCVCVWGERERARERAGVIGAYAIEFNSSLNKMTAWNTCQRRKLENWLMCGIGRHHVWCGGAEIEPCTDTRSFAWITWGDHVDVVNFCNLQNHANVIVALTWEQSINHSRGEISLSAVWIERCAIDVISISLDSLYQIADDTELSRMQRPFHWHFFHYYYS